MSDPVLGGKIDKAVVTALNGLAGRQRVIGNNLANVDTPGFKASELKFEDELKNAIARDRTQSGGQTLLPVSSGPGHITVDQSGPSALDSVEPKLVRPENTMTRVDGNNVDIDTEMVKLAETTISYNSLIQLLAARISMARYAVNEGRR